jgi:mitochondrial fission protein ELM1
MRRSLALLCHDLCGPRAVPLFFWESGEVNPYLGLLALADAIVVTSDSVSMVSEACATGRPVHVFNVGYGHEKLRKFHSWTGEQSITETKCLAEQNNELYIAVATEDELIAAFEKTLGCPILSQRTIP